MAKAVGISRTSLYSQSTKRKDNDDEAIQELSSAHELHPLYGVRRLSLHLGWSNNKTRRIRRLGGISVTRPSKKYKGYRGKPEIVAPDNHLHSYALFKDVSRPQDGMSYTPMTQEANAWAQDFTYLRIRSGMFYLALVMDLSTRQILSWKLGTNHSSSLTHIALIQAIHKNSPPSILHSDRGSEYLSQRHQDTCQRFNITLSASRPGKPWQNGYMERCIKSIKEELGSLANYQNIDELYIGIANAVHYYNNIRIHTALAMPPRDYAKSLNKPKSRVYAVFGKMGA